MEPEEYQRLEEIARNKDMSVAELIRNAVRERYFSNTEDRNRIVEEIIGMNLPTEEWDKVEEEIAEAHRAELS